MTFRLILMCARILLDAPSRWRSYWLDKASHYARRGEALWLAHLPLMLAKCPHTPRTFIDQGQPLACLECSGPEHVPGIHGWRIWALFTLANMCAHLGRDRFVDNRERGEARLSTTWMLLLSMVLGTLAWVFIWAVIGGAIADDLSGLTDAI